MVLLEGSSTTGRIHNLARLRPRRRVGPYSNLDNRTMYPILQFDSVSGAAQVLMALFGIGSAVIHYLFFARA